jgi:hypothetical protein
MACLWASAVLVYRPRMTEQAHSIEQVIDRLDGIIGWSRTTASRLGYFPALYRKVTIEVRDGIAHGAFDDGGRMERLDVIFANRYLAAVDAHREGKPATDAWVAAFAAAGRWWPIVLQHLLLGINAHINLDLGIAAAQTAPGSELPRLRGDFDRINAILARLVGDVQEELARIWPALRFFNRHLRRTETALINFSLTRAREHAWSVAEELAPLAPAAQEPVIARLDRDVAMLARVVEHPGLVLGTVTRTVRLGELGSVPQKIDILGGGRH